MANTNNTEKGSEESNIFTTLKKSMVEANNDEAKVQGALKAYTEAASIAMSKLIPGKEITTLAQNKKSAKKEALTKLYIGFISDLKSLKKDNLPHEEKINDAIQSINTDVNKTLESIQGIPSSKTEKKLARKTLKTTIAAEKKKLKKEKKKLQQDKIDAENEANQEIQRLENERVRKLEEQHLEQLKRQKMLKEGQAKLWEAANQVKLKAQMENEPEENHETELAPAPHSMNSSFTEDDDGSVSTLSTLSDLTSDEEFENAIKAEREALNADTETEMEKAQKIVDSAVSVHQAFYQQVNAINNVTVTNLQTLQEHLSDLEQRQKEDKAVYKEKVAQIKVFDIKSKVFSQLINTLQENFIKPATKAMKHLHGLIKHFEKNLFGKTKAAVNEIRAELNSLNERVEEANSVDSLTSVQNDYRTLVAKTEKKVILGDIAWSTRKNTHELVITLNNEITSGYNACTNKKLEIENADKAVVEDASKHVNDLKKILKTTIRTPVNDEDSNEWIGFINSISDAKTEISSLQETRFSNDALKNLQHDLDTMARDFKDLKKLDLIANLNVLNEKKNKLKSLDSAEKIKSETRKIIEGSSSLTKDIDKLLEQQGDKSLSKTAQDFLISYGSDVKNLKEELELNEKYAKFLNKAHDINKQFDQTEAAAKNKIAAFNTLADDISTAITSTVLDKKHKIVERLRNLHTKVESLKNKVSVAAESSNTHAGSSKKPTPPVSSTVAKLGIFQHRDNTKPRNQTNPISYFDARQEFQKIQKLKSKSQNEALKRLYTLYDKIEITANDNNDRLFTQLANEISQEIKKHITKYNHTK